MANTSMLKCRGLQTFSNYLAAIPEGSLLTADNVIIDRDGVVEPRRGIKQYGAIGTTSNDKAKQLLLYKDRVLAHYSSSLAWDNGVGVFADFAGTVLEETEAGLRVKYLEMNGNLYITTLTGIMKVSAANTATLGSATISRAGGIAGLDISAELDLSLATGFLEPNKEVAYRMVWGTRDKNDNLILGSPSYRTIVQNTSGTFRNVNVTFTVPFDVTTDYFYQIYRTASGVLNGSGDEMKLVYEDVYTSGSSITINDSQPESLQESGTILYTNEFSGEGIAQSNDRPPAAKDIAAYKNTAFYANTYTPHRLATTLVGLDGIAVLQNVTMSAGANATITVANTLSIGDTVVVVGAGAANGTWTVTAASLTDFVIDNTSGKTAELTASPQRIDVFTSSITVTKGATVNTYYFVGRPEITKATFQTQAATTDGSYFTISSADDVILYYVWFDKTGAAVDPTISGRIGIKVDIQTATSAIDVADAVAAAMTATGDFYVADAGAQRTISTANAGFATDAADGGISPFAAPTDIFVYQNGYGEDASQNYVRRSAFISPAQAIEDTAKSLTRIINKNPLEVITATYTPDTSALPGSMSFQSKIVDTTPFTVIANNAATGAMFNSDITTAVSSASEIFPNKVYFSKTSQPEAVPLTNSVLVGPKDKRIHRIIGLRDSLFILKEEGIYRLTGTDFTNFNVTLFDNSSNIIAPDTVAVLNNQIYGLTSQGVCTISETGVSIISRPIENIFSTATSPAYTNFEHASFGVGYESDRSYLLWVLNIASDTIASKAYRFNTFTQTWTSWTKSCVSAVVSPTVNKLFTGAGDLNLVEIERKTLTRDDYADRQYDMAIGSSAIDGTVIQIGNVTNITAGDAFVQTQYVTISQVLRLARKFALDNGVPNTVGNSNKDFYRDYVINPGAKLQDELAAIITQLNTDLASAFNTTYSAAFATFQTEFNSLIAALNVSPLLIHINYEDSSGTVDYEVSIISRDLRLGQVEVQIMEPLIVGPVIHFVAIDTQIVWAPSSLGDPGIMKQVRTGSMLFESDGISYATIGYNTDLSINFEDIQFQLEGDGSFGSNIYSSGTWGGEGTARPFRTLIPRQKQRCRFIRCRFKHRYAFYKYAILGISYVFELGSDRGYR